MQLIGPRHYSGQLQTENNNVINFLGITNFYDKIYHVMHSLEWHDAIGTKTVRVISKLLQFSNTNINILCKVILIFFFKYKQICLLQMNAVLY